MSVEAVSWALNLAPSPTDSTGKPNAACAFVLVGLANHAGPDGTGAFPSVKTLMRYTRMTKRTVRTALDRLEAEGLIQPCDPVIVAAHVKRPDRRPQGWDLALDRIRTDLDAEERETLEHQFPGLSARMAAVVDNRPNPAGRAVDNPLNGGQLLPPVESTGGNGRTNGGQLTHERGVIITPEPSYEPSLEPPPTRAYTRQPVKNQPDSPPADNGGGGAEAVFAKLGEAWPLADSQRARLTPVVEAGLSAGWSPGDLAAHIGANPDGVRSPYAVLRTRLADLPNPPAPAPTRPVWCGTCNPTTRLLEDDHGRPARCPTCHPLTVGGAA